MCRTRAERPGWGRWEQLAWSDLPIEWEQVKASGEPDGGVAAEEVVAALVSKLQNKNETIAELQAAMLEGARRSSEAVARDRRERELLEGRLFRLEAARAQEVAALREATHEHVRREEAAVRRAEASAAREVALELRAAQALQIALDGRAAQGLATESWAALRDAEEITRCASAHARAAEAESARLRAQLREAGVAELQGKLAFAVRAQQSAVARAEAQARARAEAEREAAAAHASLGTLHAALKGYGIEMYYPPG